MKFGDIWLWYAGHAPDEFEEGPFATEAEAIEGWPWKDGRPFYVVEAVRADHDDPVDAGPIPFLSYRNLHAAPGKKA